MDKSEIKIEKAIVHVLDSVKSNLVLSANVVDYPEDFSDFLKKHIERLIEGDDIKIWSFNERSIIKGIIEEHESDFLKLSQETAKYLYSIMEHHESIPPADLVILRMKHKDQDFLAVLKMNYLQSYTHKSVLNPNGEINDIVIHQNAFPKSNSRKLKEACLINLKNGTVRIFEKKFEINDEKIFYFSSLFLGCRGEMTSKNKAATFSKVLKIVRAKNYKDEINALRQTIRDKAIIIEEYEECGRLDVKGVAERLFDQEDQKNEFITRMLKYGLEEIVPEKRATIKNISKQKVITNAGVQIVIPGNYEGLNSIQIDRTEEGYITIKIKDIEALKSK